MVEGFGPKVPGFDHFNYGDHQGLKKAIIVMYMAIMRFVLIPFIMIYIIFLKIEENYNLIFFALAGMHWTIGLSYFYYCNKKFKLIFNK